MKIVLDYRPFVINQIIYVYDDKLIDCISATTSDMIAYIQHLVTRYGANEVIMYGNEDELSKYKEQLCAITYHNINVKIQERG